MSWLAVFTDFSGREAADTASMVDAIAHIA